MSQMIVKTQRITKIEAHPNADRLEQAHIGAWTTCVKKNVFKVGDLVVFIPPDAILPKELHEHLGITQYCGQMPSSSEEAEQEKRRVRACRLRGVKSFGTLMRPEDVIQYLEKQGEIDCGLNYQQICDNIRIEGIDVAEVLGIAKYTPPEKMHQGDQAPDNSLFHKYTDIERYQNFPSVLKEGEQVVITEKIHGTNCRVGGVMVGECFELMGGSHTTRRKPVDAVGNNSLYWKPLNESPSLREMIEDIQRDYSAVSVIVFGEIYGPGIQDMHYGGRVEFRVFDISVNGEYLDWNDVEYNCGIYGVPTVPVLYVGPFTEEVLMKYTDGKTTVCDEVTTKFKGREGCVVKPLTERQDFDVPNGRVILKSVSADYFDRKGATDNA